MGAWSDRRTDELPLRDRRLQRRHRNARATGRMGRERPRRSSAPTGNRSTRRRRTAFSFTRSACGRSCSARWRSSRTRSALGRTIPWAFEGNRLIVVPHAGYGENAYYDREQQVAPVLLLRLGAGHRLHLPLGRHRPPRIRARRPRRHPAAVQRKQQPADGRLPRVHGRSHGHPADVEEPHVAPSTGRRRRAESSRRPQRCRLLPRNSARPSSGRPYLRTALNKDKMGAMVNETSAHRLSGVLTGAMFDALIAIGERYQDERRATAAQDAESRCSGTPPIACSGRPSSRSTCCRPSR